MVAHPRTLIAATYNALPEVMGTEMQIDRRDIDRKGMVYANKVHALKAKKIAMDKVAANLALCNLSNDKANKMHILLSVPPKNERISERMAVPKARKLVDVLQASIATSVDQLKASGHSINRQTMESAPAFTVEGYLKVPVRKIS